MIKWRPPITDFLTVFDVPININRNVKIIQHLLKWFNSVMVYTYC
jgi:hypothetical protein